MKFFIDTADLEEIEEANNLGVLDGVTTNPSLCAKIGVADFEGHIAKICDMVDGDVSAEVVSTSYDDIMPEARSLAAIADNVVVKVPLIKDGIKAINALTEEGIRTNCTLCFSATQALIAAKAGATYISPFIGRLDDISEDGMQLIADVVQIYENYGYETEVLAASIRHPMHVLEAARLGADVATMPLKVIDQLLHHPLTDSGLERFLSDWDKLQEEIKTPAE
ncbi:MAG TPA: fructose-6-phosphate aldolase [Halalkalibaculum sp.]|nr:fructose-6-phosphate aldolase [Halalkalibaculum sp.]